MNIFDNLIPENGNIIAEMACGHEGDLNKLYKLIDVVENSGIKIIKFQIFEAKERVTKNHKEWDIFNKLELNEEEWILASKYAKNKKLIIFADIW